MVEVVAEVGSCWMGQRKLAEELIVQAKVAGCSAVKFQLFPDVFPFTYREIGEEGLSFLEKNGNIQMPYVLWEDLYKYGKAVGIPVTASVFDQEAVDLLFKYDLHHLKFAYSQRKNLNWIKGALGVGKRVVVSTDVMGSYDLPNASNLVKLFCVPEYPVTSKISFEGLFPWRFQGFSDHTLGIGQAMESTNHGCTWIEKHFRLDDQVCEGCPDGKFAITPKEMRELCRAVKI